MEIINNSIFPPPPQLEEIITEDGILGAIISSLPLKEAVRTCVLSRRWSHLWTYRPNLIFDVNNMLDARTVNLLDSNHSPQTCRETRALLTDKTDEFIRSVESVLGQWQGDRLEKFKVEYYLHKAHSSHIDEWLRFGVESKAISITLDLCPPNVVPLYEPNDIPCRLFTRGGGGSSIGHLSLKYCSLKLPHEFDGLNNLTVLHLDQVDVTEEDIEHLVSNCLILQSLSVANSETLEKLSISDHKLSYLDVHPCYGLEEIEIDAVNLDTLSYYRHRVHFVFRESKKVRQAYIDFKEEIVAGVDLTLPELSSNMPNLEHLIFRMGRSYQWTDLPKDSINFIRLTCLRWILDSKMSLTCLASLLNAAPFLEEFKLNCWARVVEEPPREHIMLQRLCNCPHTHLKTAEITSFYGDKWQIEIALYLLKNAIELESMTIQGGKSSEEIPEDARKYLSQEVSANAKLVISYADSPSYI